MNNHHDRNDNRGFTLLLAALIASVVLLFSASIFSIAKKQITLASTGRYSQFAFYAADTGAECALYWDTRYHVFATSSLATAHITCGKNAAGAEAWVDTTTSSAVAAGGTQYQSAFSVDVYSAYCVAVTVTKNPPPFDKTHKPTVIHADGYSVPCAAKDTNPQALQRSIELQY